MKYPTLADANAAGLDLFQRAVSGQFKLDKATAAVVANDAYTIAGYGLSLALPLPVAAVWPNDDLPWCRAGGTPEDACKALAEHFRPLAESHEGVGAVSLDWAKIFQIALVIIQAVAPLLA